MMGSLDVAHCHNVKIDGAASQVRAIWISTNLLVPSRVAVTTRDTDVAAESFAKLFQSLAEIWIAYGVTVPQHF
jgi:hypothetical protein